MFPGGDQMTTTPQLDSRHDFALDVDGFHDELRQLRETRRGVRAVPWLDRLLAHANATWSALLDRSLPAAAAGSTASW
jgi:hypothetical protein